MGGFAYAGTDLHSVQRILVEQSVYGKFVDLPLAGVDKLKTGDPWMIANRSGSTHSREGCRTSQRLGAGSSARRSRILRGGQREGSMLEPTVLTGTRPDMKVNCQEIFAPVVTVEHYTDSNDALRQINSSPYGFASWIVYPRRRNSCSQAYDELEVGGLIAGDVPAFPD